MRAQIERAVLAEAWATWSPASGWIEWGVPAVAEGVIGPVPCCAQAVPFRRACRLGYHGRIPYTPESEDTCEQQTIRTARD